jgi:hypothetical protein
MSIDDKVGRDPRITILALSLGWSKRELVGCLVLDVWPLCYDQETALVSERIIDAAAGHTGFAVAMVEAELATRDRSGKLRITGAAKRIAYLDHQKKSGREGGLKSAEMRAKESKGRSRVREASLKQTSSDFQGSGNPSASASASPSAPASPSASASDEASSSDEDPKKRAAARIPSGPHQQAIDEFDRYYQRTHNGSRPTWKDKNASLMSKLVTSHGYPEIARRIAVLEKTPPHWPPTPWDMPTFSAHFDKISSASTSAMSGLAYAKAVASGEIS